MFLQEPVARCDGVCYACDGMGCRLDSSNERGYIPNICLLLLLPVRHETWLAHFVILCCPHESEVRVGWWDGVGNAVAIPETAYTKRGKHQRTNGQSMSGTARETQFQIFWTMTANGTTVASPLVR